MRLPKLVAGWLVLAVSAASALWAQQPQLQLNKLPRVVAFLHQTGPEYAQIDGTSYEVWLKGPKDAAPVPRLRAVFGTAFFVSVGTKRYLVTAAHLARDVSTAPRITVLGDDGKPHDFPLTDFSPAPLKWLLHDKADIAALALAPRVVDLAHFLDERSFPLELLEANLVAPPLDRELTVVGFPIGLGVSATYFSPLVIRSTPASGIVTGLGVTSQFFTLERPAIGGYSGAPVFDLGYQFYGTAGAGMSSSYGPTRIVGVIQATLSDDTGGKLAVVVPASFIVELLRGAG